MLFSNDNRYTTPENMVYNGHYHDLRLEPVHFWIGKSSSRELCDPHMHDCMQLWYILRDSCIQNFNGTSYTQSAGDLMIVPPFFMHNIDTRNSNNIEFIYCEFSEGFVTDLLHSDKYKTLFNLMYLKPILANAALINPFMSFNEETRREIEYILNDLLSEYQKVCEFSVPYIRMTLMKLLTLITERYEELSMLEENDLFSKYRRAIANAQNYLHENFTKNIRLNDVCKIALMSVSSFSCVFKQITGQSFSEYLNYLRICHAQKLLTESDASITDIALACGYNETPYFNKIFKRLTGKTPGQFRKNL